jgi:deoxyxylulose-5-phosphate synthase
MRILVFESDEKITSSLDFLLCGTGIVVERAAWLSMVAAKITEQRYDWLVIDFEWSPEVNESLVQSAAGIVGEVVVVSNGAAGGGIERMCLEGVSRVYQFPADWNRIASDIKSAAGYVEEKPTGLGFPL